MGDMADFHLDQTWGDPFGGDEDRGGLPTFKICRYCGKTGLEWGLHEGKWRLHDGKGVHRCKVKPLPEKPKACEITDPVEKAFIAGFNMGRRSAEEKAYPEVGFSMPITLERAWREYIAKNPSRTLDGERIGDD